MYVLHWHKVYMTRAKREKRDDVTKIMVTLRHVFVIEFWHENDGLKALKSKVHSFWCVFRIKFVLGQQKMKL